MPAGPATFGQTIRKTIARARARGIYDVAQEFRARTAQALRSDDCLVVMARDATRDEPPPTEVEVVEGTPAHAADYARDIGTDAPSTFRSRLSEGTLCFLVVSGGRIVHATWASLEATWIGELRRYFCPPVSHGYLYESFTVPAHRGRGIYPTALNAITERLAERGVRRLWIAASAENTASLRAIAKAAFEVQFQVPYKRRLARVQVELPPEAGNLIGPKCPP